VRQLLAQSEIVVRFADAPARGGWGVTPVWVRRTP
jgi:hypothetical protein